MKLTHWLRSRLIRNRKARRLNRDLCRRPAFLERLEDRSLLASFYVALSGNDLNPGTADMPFRTIQAGINAAALVSDGPDSVNVAGGTYNTPGVDTRFDIPASPTLDNLQLLGGWNAGFTVREPGATPTDYTFTNSAAANRYDVQVLDNGTSIDGFTFHSSDGSTARDADTILVTATGVTINNNVFYTGIRSAGPRPAGVVTGGADNSALHVTNNVFHVGAASPASATTAVGVFINPSVQVAPILIDGNTIEGNNMNAGVVVSGANNVNVQNNLINRSTGLFGYGIVLRNSNGPVSNVNVIDNSILDTNSASTAYGIAVGEVDSPNTAISNVTVRGNVVNMTGGSTIATLWIGTGTNPASTLIERNSFVNPTTGRAAVSAVTGADVSGNWFGSNTQEGVDAAISAYTAGPLSNPAATIVAHSFLSSGTDDAPAPGLQLPPTTEMIVPQTKTTSGLTDVDGRIQSGIDRSLPGMTVRVAADTFTENVTISKAITVIGAVDGGGHPLVTLQPAVSSNSLVLLSGTSFGGDNNVTLNNVLYRGTNGAIKANNGILVNPPTQFGTLSVDNSDFQGFQDIGISVNGDATTGISAQNLVISNSSFSQNGSLGNGGDGDIDAFMYNGNASLSNLTLIGSATSPLPVHTHSERVGIQFRGAGDAGSGVGQLASGTVSFNSIDISGTYETNFIAIQDYTDVHNMSFQDVKLGGLNSGIVGTFGAELRFDGVGLTSGNSTINLGDTYFRANTVGSATIPAPGIAIEFAPDNTYAFLRADATNAHWDTSAHTNIASGSLTLAELFDVEDRILHYPDALNGGQPYKGFADVRANNAYVTATVPGSSIQRAADIVTSPGTVNIKPGSYAGSVDTTASGRAITLSPGSNLGQVTITGNLALNSDDALAMEINGSTAGSGYDQLIVNGTVSLGNAQLIATGSRTAHDGDAIVLINNDGADPVTGTFNGKPEGSTVVVNGVPYVITYKYNADTNTAGTGNDVALIDVSGSVNPAPGTAALVTDPCDPTKKALVVAGTSGNNNIEIKPKGNSQVEVKIDGKSKLVVNTSAVTGHIIVYAGAGNDKVTIDPHITIRSIEFGEAGKDDLHAGGGASVLVGGDGDDTLRGGKARDILIGGLGKDNLRGDGKEDLLIAGNTDYDTSVTDLCMRMDDWLKPTPDYSGFIGHVHDDGVKDDLDGQDAVDVYFANKTGTGSAKDNIHSMKNETVNDTNPTPPPAALAATLTTTKKKK